MGRVVSHTYLVWFCIIQAALLGLVTLLLKIVWSGHQNQRKGNFKVKAYFLPQRFLKSWCKFYKIIFKSILLIIKSRDPLCCAGRQHNQGRILWCNLKQSAAFQYRLFCISSVASGSCDCVAEEWGNKQPETNSAQAGIRAELLAAPQCDGHGCSRSQKFFS